MNTHDCMHASAAFFVVPQQPHAPQCDPTAYMSDNPLPAAVNQPMSSFPDHQPASDQTCMHQPHALPPPKQPLIIPRNMHVLRACVPLQVEAQQLLLPCAQNTGAQEPHTAFGTAALNIPARASTWSVTPEIFQPTLGHSMHPGHASQPEKRLNAAYCISVIMGMHTRASAHLQTRTRTSLRFSSALSFFPPSDSLLQEHL
jgi:hypothetical protein